MTVVWSIEGAEWTKGTWILSRAGLVALLLGFVLAKVRFVPGLLAHSFMFSVGMVFVGVLVFPFIGSQYEDADWTKKLGGVVLRAVKWGESGFTGYDPLVFLVSLGLVIWISGYAVAWLVFRRKHVWLAITIMVAILMVNLSYNPPHPFSSFFVFLVSSLLLVVRFNAFLNEERWRRLRMPYRSELWRGAMMVGGALVLLITAVAFAAPSSSQVEPLNQVLSQIQGPWQQIQNGLPGFGSSPNNGPQREGRLPSNYNNFSKSFTIGGPINLSDDPVLRVSGDDPKYLQFTAMDSYDGKGWVATFQDAAPGQKSDKVFNQLSLSAGQSLPTSSDQGRATYRLTVTPLIPNFNPVLTTGELVSVDRASLLAYHWERIIIKSPLTAILPKTLPDGNGGSRTITIDEASNQPIPPDLLPLLKMLNQAQLSGSGVTNPAPVLNFILDSSGHYSPVVGRGNNLTLNKIDEFTWEANGWLYKLPAVSALTGLNLTPGGVRDQSGRLKIQLTERQQPDKVVSVSAANLYLSTNGTYNFTVNTNEINNADAQRTRFEGTELGQKIKAEIDRLIKEVPGNKVSYDLRNGVPYALNFDGYQPNYDDLLATTAQQALNPGESYTTQALRFRADEQSLRRVDQAYPAWVKNRYLALPEIPQRVKDLAISLTNGLSNPYDKAKAIEAYLRTIPYSLNAPFTPEGREVVDYFLFDSKLGYCVHFSTAFNVMMRSLGIPTRELTGFNGGEFDSATGTSLVRANAYHAWPQVYFPGYGWIDFEPTPNGPTFNRPKDPAAVPPLPTPTPAPAVAVAPAPTVTAPADNSANGTDNTIKDPEESASNSASAEANKPSQAEIFFLWFCGLLAATVVCFAVYQGNQWWLRSQLSLPDVTPTAVYQRMMRAARRAGMRASPTMTPYEFAAFLGRRLPAVRGEVRSFTDGYVRERYGPQVVEDELRREIAELEAARAKIAEAEAEGREPTRAELWAAFKSQTVFLHTSREIRDMWQSYQLGLIAYRRRNRLNHLTPKFFRVIDYRLDRVRYRIQRRFKKKHKA